MSKLWTQAQELTIQKDQIILQNEFYKGPLRQKKRYLAATETSIILFKVQGQFYFLTQKDPEFQFPVKFFPLEFDLKIEIIRNAPTLQNNIQPIKLTSNARPDQVKSEHIESLGEIIGIIFSHENKEQKYQVCSHQQAMIAWKNYLSTTINQIGFHHLFKVFKKIGKGSFASVYLGERVEDKMQMAIKAFSKSVTYIEEKGKAGIMNEINIMRHLNHPNVIKLYEVYETQNSLYMCMELVQGGSLYEYLQKKVVFQSKEINSMIKGLLEGISKHKSYSFKKYHASRYQIRKFTFQKSKVFVQILILFSSDLNSVVIADFGLSTFIHEKQFLYCRCGTPGFVAPEVINIYDMSTTYSQACDIYSLGLVFYFLLTGKPAFQGKSYGTIVQKNKEAKIDFNTDVFLLMQEEFGQREALDLLKKMLEYNPKQRISGEVAIKHNYISQLNEEVITFETDMDDQSDLDERLHKINDQTYKFDMIRINHLMKSPLRSPFIQGMKTQNLQTKQRQLQDGLIMRSPVMTGRIQSVDSKHRQIQYLQDSPQTDFAKTPELQVQQKIKLSVLQQQKQQQSIGILSKYSLNQKEQLDRVDEESKDIQLNVKNVKDSLSKIV